jgi:hypothetical protein
MSRLQNLFLFFGIKKSDLFPYIGVWRRFWWHRWNRHGFYINSGFRKCFSRIVHLFVSSCCCFFLNSFSHTYVQSIGLLIMHSLSVKCRWFDTFQLLLPFNGPIKLFYSCPFDQSDDSCLFHREVLVHYWQYVFLMVHMNRQQIKRIRSFSFDLLECTTDEKLNPFFPIWIIITRGVWG